MNVKAIEQKFEEMPKHKNRIKKNINEINSANFSVQLKLNDALDLNHMSLTSFKPKFGPFDMHKVARDVIKVV